MGKKEQYFLELRPLYNKFISTGSSQELSLYLVKNSALPGRRANLELASAFKDLIAELSILNPERTIHLLLDLISNSSEIAPTNNPKEFLPFCGIWALGSIGTSCTQYFSKCVQVLHESCSDVRWRIREAAAKGLSMLYDTFPLKIYQLYLAWIKPLNESQKFLVQRAIVASLAESSYLNQELQSNQAFELHKIIITSIYNLDDDQRKSEEFKTLKKGLSYTLSVIVYFNPDKGWPFITETIKKSDKDVYWILKQNLTKNRLVKNFPKEVQNCLAMLKE